MMIFRLPSTPTGGGQFGPLQIAAVWNKATIVPRYDPAQYRKDGCGAWIARADYGTTSNYGWEIDHIVPVAKGGSDVPQNLQPLHWKNNRHKSDSWPTWSCALRASA